MVHIQALVTKLMRLKVKTSSSFFFLIKEQLILLRVINLLLKQLHLLMKVKSALLRKSVKLGTFAKKSTTRTFFIADKFQK